MPSHKIHICIGNEINKYYNYDSNLLLIGCILPDLGEEHFVSHFKKNHKEYNIEKFIGHYYDKNNPVLVGYLIHILTDDFYNKHVREKYYIHDDILKGIKTSIYEFYGTPNEVTYKKQCGFNKYDYYLINNNKVPRLTYIDLNKLPKIVECNYDENYIIEYIDTHNKMIEKNDYEFNYDIFTFKELDILYKECIDYIKKYLDKLNNS